MRKQSLLAAALLVAGLLVWSWAGPPVPPPHVEARSAVPLVEEGTALRGASTAKDDSESRPVVRTAAPDLRSCRLRVLTRDHTNGAPVPGVRVSTARGDGKTTLGYWRAGSTDFNGELVLTGLAPGWLSVRAADARDEVWESLQPSATSEVVIAVEPLIEVTGRVVDHSGVPVSTAELWVSDVNAEGEGEVLAGSQWDGSFRLAIRGADRVLIAGAISTGVSRPEPLNRPRAPDEELVVVLEQAAARVVGTVTDSDGQPVSGARVAVGVLGGMEPDAIMYGRYGKRVHGNAVVPAITDCQGAFRADVVPCASPTSVFVRCAGWAPQFHSIDVRAGETTRVDFRLERGFEVRGVVRSPDSRPAPNVVVTVRPVGVGVADRLDWQLPATASDADGTFVVTDVEVGKHTLTAESPTRGVAHRQVEGTAGAIVTWNPVLDPGRTIAGRVVDEDGGPLVDWVVEAECKGRIVRGVTDADGYFVLTRCSDGEHEVSVKQKGAWMPTDVLTLEGIVAGGAPLELRVARRTLSTGRVSGTVLDANGRPVASVISVRVADGAMSQRMSAPLPPGRFEVGPIRPGAFDIVISVAGHKTLIVPRFNLAAGEARELGTLSATRMPW